MNYRILFAGLAFCLISYLSATAQSEEKNIVIQDQTQDFFYVKSKNNVEIRESYTKVYRCNEYRTDVLFSEMYNNKEQITKVEVKVNERRNRAIKPRYDYYSIENIFYSDARVCYFELPLEKKGTTSEVLIEKTYSDPRYFTTVYFPENYLVENRKVSFHIPRWMKVELKEFNFSGFNIKKTIEYDEKHETDIITYTCKNIPAFKNEQNSPGGSYFIPHILVLNKQADIEKGALTFFNKLEDQYRWYRELTKDLDIESEIVAGKAKEITEGLNSDFEKVVAIFNWVQHNIKYLAFEDGIAGFRPAEAPDVLNKKYGDCKGMANLTKCLLKSIGLDARLCWLGTNHIAYDYSTPALTVDNHMICAWLYNGRKYFLDATETNICLNEYAERIQGRQVLIENGDTYMLEKIPEHSPKQNMRKEKAKLSFTGGTDLKGFVTFLFTGENRSSLLSNIQQVKKGNLTVSLSNYLANSNQGYLITGLTISDVSGKDSVLNISYDLYFKNAATVFGNDIYIDLDYRKELSDLKIDTAERRTDWMMPYKMHLVTEVELAIPAGYNVNFIPANASWHLPNADIMLSYRNSGSSIFYRKEIVVNQVRIRKESFSEWNKMITALNNQYKEQIIFSKQ